MASHPAPEELLADYAAGAASPGLTLLVAAHLTQAPESRAQVEAFEGLGGALLATEAQEPMSADALDAVLSQLDAPPAEPPSSADTAPDLGSQSPLPGIVHEALGMKFDDIPWKFQLPGVAAVDLDGFGDETVQILRARPGAKIPQHTHEGTEYTLVLQGCLSDCGIDYRKGDVAVNDEDDDHRPQITGDEICYCLIVQQGDLRFTGRFSRILNYIGE